MLGRNAEFWRQLLRSSSLPQRLYALRVARQMGREGAKLLLEAADGLPEWPLVWALQGCAHPATLRRAAPHTPARLAYTLQRWGRRQQRRSFRHSLEACLRGLREASHSHLRLSWMLVVLEHHQERACEALLELIATPLPQKQRWDQVASLGAWGLSQLGSTILFSVQERFRGSHPAVQQTLCQALWYLGPQGQGCESFVAASQGLWTSALLHALEGAGTRALAQRGEAPLWVDKSSLGRLVSMAGSSRREDRLFAARALPGWGPALNQVASPLESLVADSDAEIRATAWGGLEELGGVVSAAALKTGLQAREERIRRAALACFRANYDQEPVELLADPELGWLAALALQVAGVTHEQVPALLERLPKLHGLALFVVLGALSEAPASALPENLDLSALMNSAQVDVRQATARLLMAWGLGGSSLLPFGDDPDVQLSLQVTEFLIERGQPEELVSLLRDGPRLPRRLALMESKSIVSQLVRRGLSGGQLTPLLARLQELTTHHDAEVNKSAARLLRTQNLDTISWGDLDSADPHVHEAVTSLLRQQGAFPDGLRAAMLEGLYILPFTLNLALTLLPAERASALFWSAFARTSREKRSLFLEPLLELAQEGWSLLLALMAHSEPEVAEDAVLLALRWLERSGREVLEGPDLLQKPTGASAQRKLAVGLAQLLFAPHQALESRWLGWAVRLARSSDYQAATLAVQSLARYHLRGQEEERELALEGLLRANNHPHRVVRLEALTQLRKLQLQAAECWRSVTAMRLYGIDPDALVTAQRWLWIQEVEQLTSYERVQAEDLRQECQDPEVLEALKLLAG